MSKENTSSAAPFDIHLPPTHEALLSELGRRVGNAWVLTGPQRVGKRQLAFGAAALQNCAQPQAGEAGPRPCGQCPSCRAALGGAHPDILLLSPRTQTSTGKAARRKIIPIGAVLAARDDARDYETHVYEFLEVRPTYRRRVVVIDGAEYLNEQAANALLKLIEEPPHGALFLLLAEDLRAVMPTLVSRAGRLRVPPVPDRELAAAAARVGQDLSPELLDFMAGRMGLLTELDGVSQALQEARALTHAAQEGLWPALEAASSLEKTFRPDLHPEALRFVWRQETPAAWAAADTALEELQEALEAYANPALSFQVFALNLRGALGKAY